MSRFSQALKLWMPFAVVGAAVVLLTYTGIQQDIRLSANDPQIQMAHEAADALAAGAQPASLLPAQKVDVSKGLAPFLIITDESGTVRAASASLDGMVPTPPVGALQFAQAHEDNRITWQPAREVRIATVIAHYGGSQPGYVIAGRSLREAERREENLTLMAGLDFVGLLLGTFLVLLVTV